MGLNIKNKQKSILRNHKSSSTNINAEDNSSGRKERAA